ncbi:MAG TPA: YWFCY domain-containing protein, partial [Puia sp.]|nr:YWFCY domain-containing protein [Puia sp.]
MDNNQDGRSHFDIQGMFRSLAIFLLFLHCYFYCYEAFKSWGYTSAFTDRVLVNISRTGFFYGFHRSRLVALCFLILAMFGVKAKKSQDIKYRQAFLCLGIGLLIYFCVPAVLYSSFIPESSALMYMTGSLLGFILILQGGGLLARILKIGRSNDAFNRENESFPQEQRRLNSLEFLHFPTTYYYKGRKRKGWINIDPYRSLLVMGSPGSGKTWLIIRSIIRQQIAAGYAMVIFDFKYPDLTQLAYNCYCQYNDTNEQDEKIILPQFYIVSFDDLLRSHRSNPLSPSTMTDIADATELARTLLLALNRDWVEKQGDFWVESAILFLTALIWYLKKWGGGKYCTLPHVIELMQTPYADLFSILRTEPDIASHLSPFLSAYLNDIRKTLDNQISSLKIALSRLSSPALYYIMTGDDFSLEINDPRAPKILCLAGNPQRSGIYGAALSLYITTINRLVNQKGKTKSSYIYDEAATIRVNQLPEFLATGRSNRISLTLCVQDASQLKLA